MDGIGCSCRIGNYFPIVSNIYTLLVNTNEENGDEPGVFQNIDCFDIFNTSQVLI